MRLMLVVYVGDVDCYWSLELDMVAVVEWGGGWCPAIVDDPLLGMLMEKCVLRCSTNVETVSFVVVVAEPKWSECGRMVKTMETKPYPDPGANAD